MSCANNDLTSASTSPFGFETLISLIFRRIDKRLNDDKRMVHRQYKNKLFNLYLVYNDEYFLLIMGSKVDTFICSYHIGCG